MCPIRNPVARSPLLRKGGAHQRSASSGRFTTRRDLDDALDDWVEERAGNNDAPRPPRNRNNPPGSTDPGASVLH